MESIEQLKSERKVRFTLPTETDYAHGPSRDRIPTQKRISISNISSEILNRKLDERKVHGTARYINGTLNFSSTDYKQILSPADGSTEKLSEHKDEHHKYKPKLLTSCLSASKKKTPSDEFSDDSYTKSPVQSIAIKTSDSPTLGIMHHQFIGRTTSKQSVKKLSQSKKRRFIFFSPACMKRKKPVLMCTPARRKRKIGDRLSDSLNVPAFTQMQKLRYHLYANYEDEKNIAINKQLRQLQLQKDEKCADDKKSLLIIECSETDDDDDDTSSTDGSTVVDIANEHLANFAHAPNHLPLSRDNSFGSFHDFVQRWRSVQSKSLAKINQWKGKCKQQTSVSTRQTAAVVSGDFKNSDAKYAISNMYSTASPIDQRLTVNINVPKSVPLITTLLRASRNQDEELIKNVLHHIVTEGISVDDLNATDASGRTAISYICSTNVTQFLELLLHTPGIDINKPDIELNTPLHHAAESGQIGAVKMLLSESKVQIDAKNVFGFTPLMKAAIQGHVRCSKLLLFAGSSPIVTDYGRGLRAEQWARFCGRHSCAEIIEKCSRASLNDKEKDAIKWNMGSKDKLVKGRARANSTVPTTSKIPPLGVNNSIPTINNNNGGIRSKISKVFNFVSRDKPTFHNQSHSSPGSRKNSSDIESINSEVASVSASASGSYNAYTPRYDISQHKFGKSIARPLEVPKLEVTSPHNQDLIKKYENRYNNMPSVVDDTKPPALPPRRNSKILL